MANSSALSDLKQSMKDFTPAPAEMQDLGGYSGRRLNLEDLDAPLPSLVFLTLVELLGLPYGGREEKMEWSVPLVFKGRRFMVAHQKFGLRVGILDDQSDDTAKEMVRQLGRAIKIADRLLLPRFQERIRAGDVNMVNKQWMLNDRYHFFRQLAKEAFERQARRTAAEALEEMVQGINDSLRAECEGSYYTQAMLDAFYSWLEHVCILLLPFCGFSRTTDDLEGLMDADWTTKYNRVFAPNKQGHKEAQQLYERLRRVKDRYRNTLDHGMFDRSGAMLRVHTAAGAVPLALSNYANSVHYSFNPLGRLTYDEICQAFDDLQAYVRERRFPLPMKIIEASLDIRFDDEGLRDYEAACGSAEATRDFVEFFSRLADDHANMDW